MSKISRSRPTMGASPDQKRRHKACAYTILKLFKTAIYIIHTSFIKYVVRG